MATPRQNTGFRNFNIPPLFGYPNQRKVDYPQSVPSNMWLVRLDDRFKQNTEKLRIQTVPLELGVKPESNWQVIPSIGRNNPFYHYTSGEDTLEFTLDWYSVVENRQDVIDKCRWVESLSKADAYIDPPPRVLLIFGDLFKYTTWIIESAPYTLSLFNKDKNMLPQQAYQTISLKKVTSANTGILERQLFG